MKTTRGPSNATKKAELFLQKNPSTKGPDLSRKFGISLSAIYRSNWWKTKTNSDGVKDA